MIPIKLKESPEAAYWHARNIHIRWPEAEPLIVKHPEWAYKYARDVIQGRWPEAEPYVSESTFWSYFYAHDVIKGRWLEIEPIIMKSPIWAYNYVHKILKIDEIMIREYSILMYDNIVYAKTVSRYYIIDKEIPKILRPVIREYLEVILS